ncbi:MAG: hypothetical protein ACO4AY_03485 [Ilumatobacteraceae bacterium]
MSFDDPYHDDRHSGDRHHGSRSSREHFDDGRYVDDRQRRSHQIGYDEYDDYDEYEDDEYRDPRQQDGFVGDAETWLRRAIDLVANAPRIPLSSSPRIDGDELLELLDRAVGSLPQELRQARWMLKERQEFINRTRREANELLDEARAQAERMVQRTEVVRAAESRARHVVETAESDARRLKLETEDFLDQRLASFEILLDRLSRTVATGRQKLSIGSGGDDLDMAAAELEADPANVFFDQDR